MSSPGAGKTTLLEKTIDALKKDLRIGVIEGDIQSRAMRSALPEKGSRCADQHGRACHLDGT